ncbi:MAG: hypothetical protein ACXU8S_03045 [Phenylobacterium sp.]
MHSPHEPIHHRDFMPMRQQLPLRDAPTDGKGQVRFACSLCNYHRETPLADLLARHGPEFGLVAILNQHLPAACRPSSPDDPTHRRCGFHYRDLTQTQASAPKP